MRGWFAVVSLVALAGGAGAQLAYDISPDGRTIARPGLEDARAVVARGSTLPFGTTPDLVVNLRRQIGGLKIADVNGDGRNDLVAVCYISQSFPPYENWQDMVFFNGPGGLSNTPGWLSANQTHSGDVDVGDVNGDGLPDIVVIHGGSVRSDAVEIYFGTPTGPSTTSGYVSSIPGNAWGTSGVLVDIDNDGDLDLVTTNQGLDPNPYRPQFMFRNNGSGLEASPSWQSSAPEISNGVAAGDLNGDGLPDLAFAKWVNFSSAVHRNIAGTPQNAPYATVGTTGTDRGAAIGDVTGDGVPEVLFGGSPTRLYSTAGGVLTPIWASNPPFSGPQEVRLHDADGDGDLDVLEVHFSDGRAHIYQNNGGVLDTLPTWTFDAPEVGTAIAMGDLNGDGRDDLVIGYSGNVCIRVFYAQAPDCPADIAPPFGILDLADVQAFVTGFTNQDPIADLAPPFGVWDLGDVQAFVDSFVSGCP